MFNIQEFFQIDTDLANYSFLILREELIDPSLHVYIFIIWVVTT